MKKTISSYFIKDKLSLMVGLFILVILGFGVLDSVYDLYLRVTPDIVVRPELTVLGNFCPGDTLEYSVEIDVRSPGAYNIGISYTSENDNTVLSRPDVTVVRPFPANFSLEITDTVPSLSPGLYHRNTSVKTGNGEVFYVAEFSVNDCE